MDYNDLSSEQKLMIDTAMTGRNVLVDACIGSGKTTAIQALCSRLSEVRSYRTGQQPRVLYLTYNSLLKVDAQGKIHNTNTRVTNYHGFAYGTLRGAGFSSDEIGRSDSIQLFNQYFEYIARSCVFDTLVVDEYQDIDTEISELLTNIASVNPAMQKIVVGDMCQKIYDRTCLSVPEFMGQFLGENAAQLEFTKCFRLNRELAQNIGQVWGKKITGVNNDCKVMHLSFDDTFEFLSYQNPGDVLCLGGNQGPRAKMQNKLERDCPDVYNKQTLWSKIKEGDSGIRAYDPNLAIFTTYDGAKGMEKPVCVIFDWDLAYWESRISKPGSRYEIIRNIFLVAASRGKSTIIFVKPDPPKSTRISQRKRYDWGYTPRDGKKPQDLIQSSSKRAIELTWDILSKPQDDSNILEDVTMSGMFEFKNVEHVEAAYKLLKVRKMRRAVDEIPVRNFDGQIDLSPCIGICQEVMYFANTNIDSMIEAFFATNPRMSHKRCRDYREWPLESKILYLSSLSTQQERYLSQVELPLLTPEQEDAIKGRLRKVLSSDAMTQKRCEVVFYPADLPDSELTKSNILFSAVGDCDVLEPEIIYELKFVSALQHTHFLQTAMYMVGHNRKLGRLWNVRDNQMYEIEIPNVKAFMDAVIKCATKGQYSCCKFRAYGTGDVSGSDAFNYFKKVYEFCSANQFVCERLAHRAALEQLSAGDIEQYFKDLKIRLPVPGDLYARFAPGVLEQIQAKQLEANIAASGGV